MPGPAVDPVALQRLRDDIGGDEATLQDILGTFAAEAPRLLARLREAHRAGDASAMAQAAHALKGASGDIGAVGLADLARALEAQCKAGELAAAGPLLAQAKAEWARVRAALPLAGGG